MDNWKITFGGQPVTLVGTHLLPGDRAPRFEVLDGNLQPVASTQFKDKTMIISVFPSVDTAVCALQNIRFNREAARLDKDVVILSLSVDLPFAQKRFCAAEHIDNVRVYSDYRDLDFGMKYGFVIKELRLLGRGAVVVDRKGIVRYIEYVSEIKNEPDYDAVLKAVRELKEKRGIRSRSRQTYRASCRGLTITKEGKASSSGRAYRIRWFHAS